MSEAPDKGKYVVTIGEGRFEVAYTDRMAYIIDSQMLTKIVIFYHRGHRGWHIYLTSVDGSFLKRLRYISLCVMAVFEYDQRQWTSGDMYIDALYCEKIHESEFQNIQPPPDTIVLYEAGVRRPYYRWLRAAVRRIAQRIALAIQERFADAETKLISALELMFGEVPIDYLGYTVTGYKYCAGLLYGIFCRITPGKRMRVKCRPLCDIAPPALGGMCSDALENECISTQPIYEPIRRKEPGR